MVLTSYIGLVRSNGTLGANIKIGTKIMLDNGENCELFYILFFWAFLSYVK